MEGSECIFYPGREAAGYIFYPEDGGNRVYIVT
jgi:hypothetical protein